jgi:hypothetical protein
VIDIHNKQIEPELGNSVLDCVGILSFYGYTQDIIPLLLSVLSQYMGVGDELLCRGLREVLVELPVDVFIDIHSCESFFDRKCAQEQMSGIQCDGYSAGLAVIHFDERAQVIHKLIYAVAILSRVRRQGVFPLINCEQGVRRSVILDFNGLYASIA